MKIRVVPVELAEANALVTTWHRHHAVTQGHRFSLGVVDEAGELHGACTVGRPVARLAGHPRAVAEVTRLVSDGTPNACSMLYAAAARAAQAMGFERIQTYILEAELGTTLRASGWVSEGLTGESRPYRRREGRVPLGQKERWVKRLNAVQPVVMLPPSVDDRATLGLVG